MKTKQKKYIIVDKIRFLIFMTIFMVFLIAIMPVFKVNAKDMPDFAIEPIYISSGDTLWHISVKYAPNDMDVRLYLDNLIQLNKLETMVLYPGDMLYVPVYND